MRIVGGKYKGRHFNPGKSFKARPTTDLAKESLFNILQNRINFDQIKVLDLFSGTGSISFEFASRGCTDITAVELNSQHYRFIHDVINKLGEKGITVVKSNAFGFIKQATKNYNLIFADPPYDHPKFAEIPKLVLSSNILDKDGLFILEHPKNFDFSEYAEFKELRRYGSVHFSFFQC